jgi:hypothetical protein
MTAQETAPRPSLLDGALELMLEDDYLRLRKG